MESKPLPVHRSGALSDPNLAFHAHLLLPDGNVVLERFDRGSTRVEGFSAVRRAGCDHHGAFTHDEHAESVVDRDSNSRGLRFESRDDGFEAALRHRPIGFVLETIDLEAAAVLPDGPRKGGQPTRPVVMHECDESIELQRGVCQEGGGNPTVTSADGWNEGDLRPSGGERVVVFDEGVIDRHAAGPEAWGEIRVCECHRDEEIPNGRDLRQLDLDGVLLGRVSEPGEEKDRITGHGSSSSCIQGGRSGAVAPVIVEIGVGRVDRSEFRGGPTPILCFVHRVPVARGLVFFGRNPRGTPNYAMVDAPYRQAAAYAVDTPYVMPADSKSARRSRDSGRVAWEIDEIEPDTADGGDSGGTREDDDPREGARLELQSRLSAYVERGRVRVILTDNTYSMVSIKRGDGVSTFRIHHMFLDAPPAVLRALGRYADTQDRGAARTLRAYIETHEDRVRAGDSPRATTLDVEGKYHHLQQIFDRLNTDYFGGQIRARITWGLRGRRKRSRESIQLGSYTVEDALIRIHPVLDARDVPEFFVAWIVYHEMLHEVHDMPVVDGRRVYHTSEFRRAEAKYERYAEAVLWERTHLPKLLMR